MKKKSTDELIHEITSSNNITGYINSNQGEFFDTPLHQHLQQLLAERQLQVANVVDRSFKGEYIYQVFRGIRKPGRDVLICIALALELDLEDAQRLLRIAEILPLDVRNRRDAIIIFALSNGFSVPKTNDLLFEHGVLCL